MVKFQFLTSGLEETYTKEQVSCSSEKPKLSLAWPFAGREEQEGGEGRKRIPAHLS